MAPSEKFIFLQFQVDTLPRFQLNFCFFILKGQEPSFHCIHLRRLYCHALHIYTSSKKAKNTFFELLTSFLSETRADSLLICPNSDSTVKNLSKSVIIGQVPKRSSKMSDSVIYSDRTCKQEEVNVYVFKNVMGQSLASDSPPIRRKYSKLVCLQL